jgi:hypothetical protein
MPCILRLRSMMMIAPAISPSIKRRFSIGEKVAQFIPADEPFTAI